MSNRQKIWNDTVSSTFLMDAQDAFLGRDIGEWTSFVQERQAELGSFELLKQLIDVTVKDDWLEGMLAVREVTDEKNKWIWGEVNTIHYANTPLALAAQKGSWKVAQHLSQQEGVRSHFVAQSLLMGLPTDKRPLRTTKARVKTLSLLAQTLDVSSLFHSNRNTMMSDSLGHSLLNAILESKQTEIIAVLAQKVGYEQLWSWTRLHLGEDVMGKGKTPDKLGRKAKGIEQLWLATPPEHLPDDIASTLQRWAHEPASISLMPQLVAGMDKKALQQAVETQQSQAVAPRRKVM